MMSTSSLVLLLIQWHVCQVVFTYQISCYRLLKLHNGRMEMSAHPHAFLGKCSTNHKQLNIHPWKFAKDSWANRVVLASPWNGTCATHTIDTWIPRSCAYVQVSTVDFSSLRKLWNSTWGYGTSCLITTQTYGNWSTWHGFLSALTNSHVLTQTFMALKSELQWTVRVCTCTHTRIDNDVTYLPAGIQFRAQFSTAFKRQG